MLRFHSNAGCVVAQANAEKHFMSQLAEIDVGEIHYEPDCPPEQIADVLLALDRWSGRTSEHVTHLRSGDRHEYRTTVTIETSSALSAGNEPPRLVFHVPSRNVSKAGLGMVVPPVFIPRLLSDETPLLRAETVFRVGTRIKITLGRGESSLPVVNGEVIRLRPIHFGFFDVGVRFVARAH
jgi:hypothetical protein